MIGFEGKVVGIVDGGGKEAAVLIDAHKLEHLYGNVGIMKGPVVDETLVKVDPLLPEPQPALKLGLGAETDR